MSKHHAGPQFATEPRPPRYDIDRLSETEQDELGRLLLLSVASQAERDRRDALLAKMERPPHAR